MLLKRVKEDRNLTYFREQKAPLNWELLSLMNKRIPWPNLIGRAFDFLYIYFYTFPISTFK